MFNIFKTSENERRLLVDRAQLLGNFWVPYIEIDTNAIIRQMNHLAETKSHVSQSAKKLDSAVESRLFAEILSFYIHVADRFAVETLNAEKRGIFMAALFETTQSAAALCQKADSTIQEMSLFAHFYDAFNLEYSKFIHPEDRLFWEFSKKLAGIAKMQKGPELVVLVGYFIEGTARLCLSTLMNPKKSLDDWSEHLEYAEKIYQSKQSKSMNEK